jgi:hypothetical protein
MVKRCQPQQVRTGGGGQCQDETALRVRKTPPAKQGYPSGPRHPKPFPLIAEPGPQPSRRDQLYSSETGARDGGQDHQTEAAQPGMFWGRGTGPGVPAGCDPAAHHRSRRVSNDHEAMGRLAEESGLPALLRAPLLHPFGHDPPKPARDQRMRGVHGGGHSHRTPSYVPDLWQGGMLRQLESKTCPETLRANRPSAHQIDRTRRGVGLVLSGSCLPRRNPNRLLLKEIDTRGRVTRQSDTQRAQVTP